MQASRHPFHLAAIALAAALAGSAAHAGTSSAAETQARPAPAATAATVTAVLVHGAFADGSSWNKVIARLQRDGIPVVAVQNPLTSLADDVAVTRRAIDQVKGDVILVGHSWAGTVITEAGVDPKVKGLVYVAAFAPETGQSTGEQGKNYATPPGLGKLAATSDGYLYLPAAAVKADFAPDVPAAEAAQVAATQGLIRAAAFDDRVSQAAWQSRPSWFVVSGQDHMINPQLQRDTAKRIHARTTEIASSHTSMLSHPEAVAKVIEQAVRDAGQP